MKILWVIIMLVLGALLPIQGGLNCKLTKFVSNPIFTAFVSFFVGTICLTIYLLTTKQAVNFSDLHKVPLYVWLGGFIGALYISVLSLAIPNLGLSLTFGSIIVGESIISVIMDHRGILVEQIHLISFPRILGVILMIAGLVLLKLF